MKRRLSDRMLWVCLDSYDDTNLQGKCYSIMKEEPIVFLDWNQFVLETDGFFDEVGFPQSFQKKRSFQEETIIKIPHPKQKLTNEDIRKQSGTLATVIIAVESRQYTNWQGVLMNVEFEVIAKFHDVIELMKQLMKFIEKQKP